MSRDINSFESAGSDLTMAPSLVETPMGEVTIRPMDGEYVLAGDVLSPNFFGQNGQCVSDSPLNPRTAKPNLAVSALHRALAEQYDAPPILAWLDGLVVGFLNVFPEGLVQEKTCMLEEDLEKAGRIKRDGLTEVDTDTLILGCLTVAPNVRNQGIGKGLVRCLQEKTRDSRWKKLRTECHADNHPDRWKPQLSFWKELGFEVVSEPSPENAEKEKRLFSACAICGAERQSGEDAADAPFGTYVVEYVTN